MKTPRNLVKSWLRSVWLVSLLFWVLLMPSIAYADTAISSATTEILNVLIPVLVSLVGLFATWILAKVKQKLHLDVSQKTSEAWAELARKAALRGGEWARKKSKELTDGKKVPGGEVMEVAASWAVEMAKQQKLPEMARSKLEGLIEAHLHEMREAAESPTPPAA